MSVLSVFLPYVQRLVEERDLAFTFVDVGSRNGVLELASLASYTIAYGFEPNPDEYHKLVSGTTDAAAFGIVAPPFRRLTCLPYAIGDTCGTGYLHITRGPGACGIRAPNLERLCEIKWKGRSYHPNFGDEIFAVLRTEPIELRTLEWVLREHAVEHVDYLKIDLEGYEYEVLLALLREYRGDVRTRLFDGAVRGYRRLQAFRRMVRGRP